MMTNSSPWSAFHLSGSLPTSCPVRRTSWNHGYGDKSPLRYQRRPHDGVATYTGLVGRSSKHSAIGTDTWTGNRDCRRNLGSQFLCGTFCFWQILHAPSRPCCNQSSRSTDGLYSALVRDQTSFNVCLHSPSPSLFTAPMCLVLSCWSDF